MTAARKMRRSMVEDERWVGLEKASIAAFGRDTGKQWFDAVRDGEHDIRVGAIALLGIQPLEWQVLVWEAMQRFPFVTPMLPNAGGKTSSFCIYYPDAAFYRRWAPEWWGLYRMLHHGPKETHALQYKIKFDEILGGRAREQAYRAKRPDGTMGWLYRPAPIALFTKAVKHDKGEHEGYDFFGGGDHPPSAMLTLRSTAYKAEGSDGTDPYFVGEDEVRHEDNLEHFVEVIAIPRSLRSAGMRIYLPATSLDASVEFLTFYERGASGRSKDWFAINLSLKDANPTIDKGQQEIVRRNVSRKRAEQIFSGRPVQPPGAKYSGEAIARSFEAGEPPVWLETLGAKVCDCESCLYKAQDEELAAIEPLMTRVRARCLECQIIAKGGRAIHPPTGDARHPVVGACDPSSSGTKDAIVATAWDLWPPKELRDRGYFVDCVYIEELEPGTRIHHVARHLVKMALHLSAEMGYDHNGPLGHAINDLAVDVDPDAELVPVEWNTKQQKDKSLDWFKAVLEHLAIHYYHHLPTRAQTANYVRELDRKLKTDFLMAQIYCCEMSRSYLPDFYAPKIDERSELASDDESLAYIGLGEDGDPYAYMGDDVPELVGPVAS